MVKLGKRDLTPRQLEVIQLYVGGLSYKVIAERLVISQRTVGSHLRDIKLKLGVDSIRKATHHFAKAEIEGVNN